jgi:glycosyltransferase involved in cell wall biosynthesis
MALSDQTATSLSIVVPIYNDQQSVDPFLQRTIPVAEKISKKYEIIFVLDPSTDDSEKSILEAVNRNPKIKVLVMSRRFGQPAATLAGLAHSCFERIVVIDIDLQDPPELILELNAKMNEGFDVVYGTRRTRQGETLVKKNFAKLGYRIINSLSDVQIPKNTGDFRIMSRRVVNEICSLQEKHGFLRGLVAYVGFKQTAVVYDRDVRFVGTSKYNKYFGSLKIGLNGLIGFSAKPLNLMAAFGGLVALFSFLVGAWYAVQKLFGIALTPGLSTTVILISFFAGVQLLSLGLVGEYISRIYDEVKNRPMYIVNKKYGFKKNDSN